MSLYAFASLVLNRKKRRSLADQDTDRWIFEVLAPDIRRKLKDIKEGNEWTDLVLARSYLHSEMHFFNLCLL